MRPLMLEYPDDLTAIDQNDEYFFGNDLLVAPVTKDYDITRRVYLPRGLWYDFWTDHRYTGPATIDVDAPMNRIPSVCSWRRHYSQPAGYAVYRPGSHRSANL